MAVLCGLAAALAIGWSAPSEAQRRPRRVLLDFRPGEAEGDELELGVVGLRGQDVGAEHLVEVLAVLIQQLGDARPVALIRADLGEPMPSAASARTKAIIKVEVFGKHQGKILLKATYSEPATKDSPSRDWVCVPEAINYPIRSTLSADFNFDGVEIVSDPLQDRKPLELLRKVGETLIASGRFEIATQSSNHKTFSVLNIVTVEKYMGSVQDANGQRVPKEMKRLQAEADGMKLARTILYLEETSHYTLALASPRRYGTMINRFAVPMAVDQRQMLIELSEMVIRGGVTQGDIRRLFEKYEKLEIYLTGTLHRAFKYRMWQYKKLLGLRGGDGEVMPFVPAIEGRFPDFDPDRSLSISDFMLHLMRNADANYGEAHRFRDPYEGIVRKVWGHAGFTPRSGTDTAWSMHAQDFEELNDRILALPVKELRAFVAAQGLNPDDHAPYEGFDDWRKLRAEAIARQELRADLDRGFPARIRDVSATLNRPLSKSMAEILRSHVDRARPLSLELRVDDDRLTEIPPRRLEAWRADMETYLRVRGAEHGLAPSQRPRIEILRPAALPRSGWRIRLTNLPPYDVATLRQTLVAIGGALRSPELIRGFRSELPTSLAPAGAVEESPIVQAIDAYARANGKPALSSPDQRARLLEIHAAAYAQRLPDPFAFEKWEGLNELREIRGKLGRTELEEHIYRYAAGEPILSSFGDPAEWIVNDWLRQSGYASALGRLSIAPWVDKHRDELLLKGFEQHPANATIDCWLRALGIPLR